MLGPGRKGGGMSRRSALAPHEVYTRPDVGCFFAPYSLILRLRHEHF